jgi:rod shape-determining protein MreD
MMKQTLVHVLTYALILIVAFTLQTSVFFFFPLADITPNLLLLVVVAAGFMRGRKAGMTIGFFAGLLVDIFFGEYLGAYAFIYMVFGFVNGFFNHLFYAEDLVLPIVLIAANDFIYGNVIYLIFYLMRSRWNYLFYLKRIILPEAVYTTIAGLVLYYLILWIDGKLRTYEKRSA